MSIALFRVDERLIHGQVVVGWGERLNIDRIIVVDDAIVDSPWEQELYCLGVPDRVEALFVTVDEARRRLQEWGQDGQRSIVLVRSIATLDAVAKGGLMDGMEVNLGGLHHAQNRTRVLQYLFLSNEDRAMLRDIAANGVIVSARDLPASRPVPLKDLLRDA